MKRARVVIVGAGFGGLEVARKLKKADVDIILLDKLNHHVSQPLLYQVATGALSAADIAVPLREVFCKQNNVEIRVGTVVGVQKKQKLITLADGEEISYDYLVLAPGARHSYFERPEWESYAPGLKTIDDAVHLREKILSAFERAERWAKNRALSEKWMTFVVIGGGPTGVEFAGALAELSKKTLADEYVRIDTTYAQVILIEALPRILPTFSEESAKEAEKALQELGVQVLTSTSVTHLSEGLVQCGDKTIAAGTIIWSAGNEAPSFLKTVDVPHDKAGRLLVTGRLHIEQYPEIFVIGDAACCIDSEKKPLPGVAAVAIQQAEYVAASIEKGGVLKRSFAYKEKMSLATIGRGKAVAKLGSRTFTGIVAWLSWCCVQLRYLVGLESRFFVFLHWLGLYCANHRHSLFMNHPLDEKKG